MWHGDVTQTDSRERALKQRTVRMKHTSSSLFMLEYRFCV
jgi:hypothetical protein